MKSTNFGASHSKSRSAAVALDDESSGVGVFIVAKSTGRCWDAFGVACWARENLFVFERVLVAGDWFMVVSEGKNLEDLADGGGGGEKGRKEREREIKGRSKEKKNKQERGKGRKVEKETETAVRGCLGRC